MELTKEQIQKVENYLDVKDITFIDIRLEVLDHIISDIEVKMESENQDFETAFNNVTVKWNKHLKHSSSYLFGLMFSVPKIVLEKAKKSYIKWYYILIPVFLGTFFLIEKLKYFLAENLLDGINLTFQILSIFSFIVFVVIFLLKSNNKILTTYRFILNTQSINFLFGFIVLVDFNYFNKEGNLDAIKVAMLVGFIYSTCISLYFYKKHKEAIKKYKIS